MILLFFSRIPLQRWCSVLLNVCFHLFPIFTQSFLNFNQIHIQLSSWFILRMENLPSLHGHSLITGLQMVWWSSSCNNSFISYLEDNPACHLFQLHYNSLGRTHYPCSSPLSFFQVFIKLNLSIIRDLKENERCGCRQFQWGWMVC